MGHFHKSHAGGRGVGKGENRIVGHHQEWAIRFPPRNGLGGTSITVGEVYSSRQYKLEGGTFASLTSRHSERSSFMSTHAIKKMGLTENTVRQYVV